MRSARRRSRCSCSPCRPGWARPRSWPRRTGYADGFPDADVSTPHHLSKLGPAAADLSQGGLIIAGIVAVGVIALLLVPRTRGWAWLVPLLGSAAWVVTVIVCATTFEPPPPELGG